LASHYKPRHFAGHGYGDVMRFPSSLSTNQQNQQSNMMYDRSRAPLASLEDITPSLRSSFASVMMYPPSDWGNSDESFDSTIMVNLAPHADNDDDQVFESDQNEKDKAFVVPESKFHDFRISPTRHHGIRKNSLSSLSVQSAL
jgi:hypothetical protein